MLGEGNIKMSKTLGNVVNPKDIAEEYGTDALRYFFCLEKFQILKIVLSLMKDFMMHIIQASSEWFREFSRHVF